MRNTISYKKTSKKKRKIQRKTKGKKMKIIEKDSKEVENR